MKIEKGWISKLEDGSYVNFDLIDGKLINTNQTAFIFYSKESAEVFGEAIPVSFKRDNLFFQLKILNNEKSKYPLYSNK